VATTIARISGVYPVLRLKFVVQKQTIMSTKTAKKSQSTKPATKKNTAKKNASPVVEKDATAQEEILVLDESLNTTNDNQGNKSGEDYEIVETKGKTKKASAKKAVSKAATITKTDNKIPLVASCYHYYRNWIKDWLHSNGVPSARFLKNSDSYNGYITVSESEKAPGLKALALWKKENPDSKELFWNIN